jgi:hypothetical protein
MRPLIWVFSGSDPGAMGRVNPRSGGIWAVEPHRRAAKNSRVSGGHEVNFRSQTRPIPVSLRMGEIQVDRLPCEAVSFPKPRENYEHSG